MKALAVTDNPRCDQPSETPRQLQSAPNADTDHGSPLPVGETTNISTGSRYGVRGPPYELRSAMIKAPRWVTRRRTGISRVPQWRPRQVLADPPGNRESMQSWQRHQGCFPAVDGDRVKNPRQQAWRLFGVETGYWPDPVRLELRRVVVRTDGGGHQVPSACNTR